MENNKFEQIEIIVEHDNEKELSEMLENCTRIMNYNISFKNKQDKYVFDRLPISPEDKIEIINSIIAENADNIKIKNI
jgi:hypothetical protein